MQALQPRGFAPKDLTIRDIPVDGKLHTVVIDPTTGQVVRDYGEKPVSEKGETAPNLQVKDNYPINGVPSTVVWNPKTGKVVENLGATPQRDSDPNITQARYFTIERGLRTSLMQEMAQQGYGKLVQNPDGSINIKWDNPSEAVPEFEKRLTQRVNYEKNKGRLPQDWYTPGLKPEDDPSFPDVQGGGSGAKVQRIGDKDYLIEAGRATPIINTNPQGAAGLQVGSVFRINGDLYRKVGEDKFLSYPGY